jgi:hypothetical protein
VSLLTDALIEGHSASLSSWRFGKVAQPERVPSREVPLYPGLLDAIRGLLVWKISDLKDARALWRLMSGYPKPMRTIPWLGFCELPHWVWFTYSFLAIKFAYSPAARFAAQFDELQIVNYVNTKSMALVRAFRASGKPVCEIQHGLIGPTHPGYSNRAFWQMESWITPTRFLVWNQTTREFLESVSGRPAEVRSFDDSYYLSASDYRRDRVRRSILLTLQWGTTLPEQIIEMVHAFSDVHWILRPHPRDPISPMDRPDCARLSRLEHVEISDPASPLIVELARCELHVTENSSVVIEAATCGRKSIFWDVNSLGAFDAEVGAGMALCREPVEVACCVRQLLDHAAAGERGVNREYHL